MNWRFYKLPKESISAVEKFANPSQLSALLANIYAVIWFTICYNVAPVLSCNGNFSIKKTEKNSNNRHDSFFFSFFALMPHKNPTPTRLIRENVLGAWIVDHIKVSITKSCIIIFPLVSHFEAVVSSNQASMGKKNLKYFLMQIVLPSDDKLLSMGATWVVWWGGKLWEKIQFFLCVFVFGCQALNSPGRALLRFFVKQLKSRLSSLVVKRQRK